MDPRDLLTRAVRSRPAGTAVICDAARLTYPDLARLARRMGAAWSRSGVRAGDRVATLFPNCHLFLAAYYAALEREFILVPLNLRLASRETAAVLAHSGATLLAGRPDLVAPLGSPVEIDPEGWAWARLPRTPEGSGGPPPDTAHLYYTSGTTGRPKGVILTRGNVAAHVAMTLDELGFGPDDAWLHAAPMFHLADAWAVWTTTAAAATHVMLPRWEPAAALDLMGAARVTLTNLVPAMIPALIAEAAARPASRPRLRILLSGGAPIAPAVVGRIESVLGCEYAQTYGLTETSPFLTFSLLGPGERALAPDEQRRLRARTGRPARGVSLRVVSPPGSERFDDVPADDASVGEVIVRGPTVTPGYWHDAEETARAFRGGWFHTGDLGVVDGRGFLNLVDRAKDVIVTGGESVYCIEVENVLLEHPGVREAAVFGVPDEDWGEAVRAVVVPAAPAGADPAEVADPARLLAFCRGRIAAYKCPRAIDIVEALPRTGSGKIDKKALRAPFWAGRDRRIN